MTEKQALTTGLPLMTVCSTSSTHAPAPHPHPSDRGAVRGRTGPRHTAQRGKSEPELAIKIPEKSQEKVTKKRSNGSWVADGDSAVIAVLQQITEQE